jgi:hypothetical protein
VDAKKLAILIISSLEGALMIGRLERDREALMAARSHLERYLETEVRLSRSSARGEANASQMNNKPSAKLAPRHPPMLSR